MGDSENTKEKTPTPTPPKEEAEQKTPTPKTDEPSRPAEPDLMESIPFANWLATGKSWGTSIVQTAKDRVCHLSVFVDSEFCFHVFEVF